MTLEAAGVLIGPGAGEGPEARPLHPALLGPVRRLVGLAFAVIGLLCAALPLLVPLLLPGAARGPVWLPALAASAGVALGLGALWWLVSRRLLQGAAALAGEVRLLAHGGDGACVDEARYAELAPLPDAINALALKLARARADIDRAVAQSTARTEEQKSRLAAILHDLNEGVVVCNLEHQILLYNQPALKMLQVTGDLGLGRSLLQLVVAEPVLHTLERLSLRSRDPRREDHGETTAARFVAGTTDDRMLLQGRMSLIRQPEAAPLEGTAPGGGAITGYVVSFTDATQDLQALGQRDALLREATEGLRGPVANLRAMIETLFDDLEADDGRAGFGAVLMAECNTLSERLEALSSSYRSLISRSWPMSDLHADNLFNLVRHRLEARSPVTLTQTGLPLWLHGDSFSLVVLLDFLIEQVHQRVGGNAFDLSVERGERWVYLDLSWLGAPLASAEIDRWLSHPLTEALGGLTVADVLQHHGSELWSEAARAGMARLRLPLPLPQEPPVPRLTAGSLSPESRPEFFDFSLLAQPMPTGELRSRPLSALTYVVFDTETTGLSPSDGDEIVALAGIRIVNGRLLTGETFSSLVNPRRPIPAESVAVHGITDAMVQGQPPIEQVLPQFKAFVADAVLVAHNAAFDLKCLKLKTPQTGIRFDNPVLDTMLLSMRLLGRDGDHSLEALAARLGVPLVDRHTALGDSLVTAAVFLRLVELMQERGMVTLDDAIRDANILVELHQRERLF